MKNYGLVTSIEELERFRDRLLAGDDAFGFDIETGYDGPDQEKASVHPETAMVVGISFTNSTEWARYAPLRHDVGENLDNYQTARLLWPLLSSGRGVAHNAPFEMRHLSRWFRHYLSDDADFGDQVRATNGYFPVRSDTQVEAYLMAAYQRFGLKYLVNEMFGHTMTELHELFPNLAINKRKYLRFNTLELTPQVVEYACEDSLWCLAIHRKYYPKVKDQLLYKVEMGILDCICEMEDFGVQYDWAYMRRGAEELRTFRDRFNAEIMSELSEMVGTTVAINLAAPAQVSAILYGKLGMTTTVYTAASRDKPAAERRMSTGKIALAGLSKQYPVVKKILEWKEMTRLLGTYLDKYEKLYGYAADGRTHPNHMSAIVVTGRFAVSDPPYQQSPKKYHFDLQAAREAHDRGETPESSTCFTFNFRDAIVAPPGHYILGFDLSQAELRAIAGEAQETALLRAFEAGEDVHTLTASLMLRVPTDQVTKDMRAVGKTMNFALLYGMGVQSLAERLALSKEEAQALYDQYFSAFSSIAIWNERQVSLGKTQGSVTSKFGRKLPIWEYQSDKKWIRDKGDRACVNYPIQGAATGDYVKIAMVRARKALQNAGLHDRVHLVMNVHDALEFYVDRSLHPQEVIRVLQPAVIFPVAGWPPMRADWHIATKWGSPIELEVTSDGDVTAKDNVETDLLPTVEVDEDTGEEIVVLPDVEAVRQAVAQLPRPAQHYEGKQLIVELDDMPTEVRYRQFRELLDKLPGTNQVALRTPEGELAMDQLTGLDLEHQAQVALIFGAARVLCDASSVDAHELVKGLSL